mgnify:CR=1 FL=1
MKKDLKVLGILLPLCSTVFLAAGCGGNNRQYDPNNFNETGDQIVKEKISLKFVVPRHHLQSNWKDMKLFKKLEERTNIHIDFIEYSVETYGDSVDTHWATNDLPDAFFTYNSITDIASHGRNGVIYELGDYLDSYAPNYKALVSRPEYKEHYERSLIDGKIYSPAMINDVPRDQTFKQFLNVQWIKNIQDRYFDDHGEYLSENPATLEEYEKILYAFKKYDANKDGNPDDEIPLSSYSMYQTRNFILSALGHVSTGFELNNGQVGYVQTTDAYRKYLELCRKWFVDGILDGKVFEKATVEDLAREGSKCGSFDSAAAYLIAGKDKDKDYIAVQPLTSSINSRKMWLKFSTVSEPSVVQIPKTTPYVREIVRWIDNFYGDYGLKLASFGEEGVDWQWNNEEHSSFHFNVDNKDLNPDNKSLEEFRGTLTCGPGTGIPYWSKEFVLKDDNEYTSRINEVVKNAGYENYFVEPMPYIILDRNDSKKMNQLNYDISTAGTTFELKAITGKDGFVLNDTTWNSQLNKLKTVGLGEALEIYQRYI